MSREERLHKNCPMCKCEIPSPKSLTKRCYKCGETKLITEFAFDRSRHDGMNPRCKACHRVSVAESARKRRARNREKNDAS